MKQKILFVIDSLQGGGAERVVSILANYISAHYNVQVDIVLLFNIFINYEIDNKVNLYDSNGNHIVHRKMQTNSKNTKISAKINDHYKKNIITSLRDNLYEFKDRIKKAKKLSFLINQNNYQAACSFLSSSNEILCMAKKYIRVKTKIVISERNDPNQTLFNNKAGVRALKRYHFSDIIVFQTESAKKLYPTPLQKKGIVIKNPICNELPVYHSCVRRKEIVTFGRFYEQKNLKLLINSFNAILVKHPDYTLHLYGKGPLKDDLINLAIKLGIKDNVKIDDFKSDIHKRIIDSAMYVSSSNYEGISNSMLEAMAIGLPCVCTDCPSGGARETITNGVNGLLVPVGDKDKLAEAMLTIIENPQLANQLSKNAIKIRETLSTEKIVKQWLDLM